MPAVATRQREFLAGLRQRVQRTPASKRRYIYDDFLKFPDDGIIYEIIEGELHMSPSPFFHHQQVHAVLFNLLFNYVERHQLGVVVSAPMDIVFGMTNIVEPDIIFISNERKEIIAKRIIGAPDLLVEIISENTEGRDRVMKKALYEKFGVTEYWIVDPDEETVDQFILKKNKYVWKGSFDGAGTIRSQAVKGFSIKVKKLFT
ncbi:MAG: Uma2 family endonuclease [Ignavibacteriae bacterium]|nr:Uma2 family endonuclease [Ignavibacteriota bacterium]